MSFDETRKCDNCLFHIAKPAESPLIRCRFNAPVPKMYNLGEDNTKNNMTRYPKCPGPACGQWQTEEEPEIIIEPEIEITLPDRINKDEED